MSGNRSLEVGFGPHTPQSFSDIRAALKTGLLSLDANMLLQFYRYSPKGRAAILDVLRAAGDRVWVSHQAALEFWRNRCSAIDSRAQATSDLATAIEKSQAGVEKAVNAWARQTAVPEEVKISVVEGFADAIRQVSDVVREEAAGAERISYATDNDSVLDALKDLLYHHVGPPLRDEEHEAAVNEGNRRANEGEPPGFRDVEKIDSGGPDGASGDYLVWIQSVQEATRRGLPLVIVTGDQKEDWWWRYKGAFLGPRSELAREFGSQSPDRLYMLLPEDLTTHAGALDVDVPEDATEDIARAGQGTPWSRDAVLELLRRLEREGAVQAKVIREAAAHGGSIDRERVYEIDGRPEDKTLRGFTKPAARVTAALQSEGLVPFGVSPALEPRYDTGVIALRFEVPQEFVEFLSDDAD